MTEHADTVCSPACGPWWAPSVPPGAGSRGFCTGFLALGHGGEYEPQAGVLLPATHGHMSTEPRSRTTHMNKGPSPPFGLWTSWTRPQPRPRPQSPEATIQPAHEGWSLSLTLRQKHSRFLQSPHVHTHTRTHAHTHACTRTQLVNS